jgi:hypothetical protein
LTTVIRFPDRKVQVESERNRARTRRSFRSMTALSVSVAKSALIIVLAPFLLWLSVLDRIEREDRADDE